MRRILSLEKSHFWLSQVLERFSNSKREFFCCCCFCFCTSRCKSFWGKRDLLNKKTWFLENIFVAAAMLPELAVAVSIPCQVIKLGRTAKQANAFYPVQNSSHLRWRHQLFLEPPGCIRVTALARDAFDRCFLPNYKTSVPWWWFEDSEIFFALDGTPPSQ